MNNKFLVALLFSLILLPYAFAVFDDDKALLFTMGLESAKHNLTCTMPSYTPRLNASDFFGGNLYITNSSFNNINDYDGNILIAHQDVTDVNEKVRIYSNNPEELTIASMVVNTGALYPNADDSFKLGTAANRYEEVFVSLGMSDGTVGFYAPMLAGSNNWRAFNANINVDKNVSAQYYLGSGKYLTGVWNKNASSVPWANKALVSKRLAIVDGNGFNSSYITQTVGAAGAITYVNGNSSISVAETSGTGANTPLQVFNTGTNVGGARFQTVSNVVASGNVLYMDRARGTTTTPLIVTSGNTIFDYRMRGFDGLGMVYAAFIQSKVDGTPTAGVIGTAGIVPGRIDFSTKTSTDNGDPELKMSLRSNGVEFYNRLNSTQGAKFQNMTIKTYVKTETLNATKNITIGSTFIREDGGFGMLVIKGSTFFNPMFINTGQVMLCDQGTGWSSVQTPAGIDGIETDSSCIPTGNPKPLYLQFNSGGKTVIAGETENYGNFTSNGHTFLQGNVTIKNRLAVKSINITGNRSLCLYENATQWTDSMSPLVNAKAGASKIPTFEAFQGNIYQWSFTDQAVFINEEELFTTIQMPHGYKLGSNINCHLHWSPKTNPVGTQYVNWTIEVSKQDIGSVFPAPTQYKVLATVPASAFTHSLANFGSIGSCSALSCVINIMLKRGSSKAGDTYTGNAFVHFFDCHFEQDSLGSDLELRK